MAFGYITRRGGGGSAKGTDLVKGGDIKLYSVAVTNISGRGSFALKQAAGEKRGLLSWRELPWGSGVAQMRTAEIDWENKTATLVVQPSGVTNKIYSTSYSSGTFYIGFLNYEFDDYSSVPHAVYIPEL